MKKINTFVIIIYALTCICIQADAEGLKCETINTNRIRPYSENPRYWQYKGKPVLLLGGTDDDNLFQWTGSRLTEHLDLLKSVGGNYVRCTMSSRDEGNVWPFKQVDDKYDLDQWNNEYWLRFENFLKVTHERDIIVQVEIWATYDFYRKVWQGHPFNPKNNINYTVEQTGLSEVVDHQPGHSENIFFQSVPTEMNQKTVLKYQRRFVDKMLSIALKFDHVLYSMDNETAATPQWGKYWSEYVKSKAKQVGVFVETTEMWYDHLDKDPPIPHATFDDPKTYSFVDVSQNSHKRGQRHWESLRLQLSRVDDNVRPLTNVKIYGADTGPERWFRADVDGVERFWRNIFGGMASARFHRPPAGLGLGEKAQAHIKSMRMITDELDIFTSEAHNDLLSDRMPNEAYCLANPGKEYAVYFPDSGEVKLDISLLKRLCTIRWLEISTVKWGKRQELKPVQSVTLCPPKSGAWIALLVESGVADAGHLDPAIEDKVVVDVLRVHPKNPLYFTVDSQEAIFLGGHQIFVDLQDNTYNKPFTRNKEKTLDWPAYLTFLESTNMNYLRNWIIFSTGSGSMAPVNKAVAGPMPYLRVPGHGKANDGGLKFDLYQFNDAFFQRLYKRCKDLRKRNIYVSIMLFEVYGFGDGEKCGEPPQNLWDGNVFNSTNNINEIDANLDKDNTGLEFFYTKDPKILDLQKAYIKKIIDILNPLDNIFYEIANELYAPEWQMSIIDFIKKYEMTKPKQHLVLFSSGGRLADNKWKVIAKDKVIKSKADCFACMGDWDSKAFREITPPINDSGKPGIIDLDHINFGSTDVAYLWTAFTQGYHFNLYETPYEDPDKESPEWANIRHNIGKAVEYSQKVDLANMKPRPDLSSTKFCLAKEGCEYIIYQQNKSEFTVSGLEPGKRYNLEWYAAGKNQSESSFIYPEKSEVIFIPKYGNMVLFVHLPNF